MRGMLLAAGLGTRMHPLSEELPKPVLPVLGRPLLALSIEHMARSGIEQLLINTHHLADALHRELDGQLPPGVEARFIHEEVILGTGGGIRNAWRPASPDELLVAMNGDVLFAPDIAGAVALHRRTGAIATLVLRPLPDPIPRGAAYGSVELDEAGRVRRLLGRPEHVAEPLTRYMFAGVHVLGARATEDLPEHGCILRQAHHRWIDQGEVVAGFVDPGPWLDLGTKETYFEANMRLLQGDMPWPGLPAPRRGALIAPTAQVAPTAKLEHTIVADRCQVAAEVHLHRCILWHDASVAQSLRNAIVTTSGRTVQL